MIGASRKTGIRQTDVAEVGGADQPNRYVWLGKASAVVAGQYPAVTVTVSSLARMPSTLPMR